MKKITTNKKKLRERANCGESEKDPLIFNLGKKVGMVR